jgi:hypothetical protein
MPVIWKQQLRLADLNQDVVMPRDAQIVHFAMQDEFPTFWFRCYPEASQELRTFYVVGTGDRFSSQLVHRGTCFDGEDVWHLMEG